MFGSDVSVYSVPPLKLVGRSIATTMGEQAKQPGVIVPSDKGIILPTILSMI